ncbi:MAG: hypothetical protein LBG77_00825, partial [Dysgonamonadaceae bacterium]|nr:hypothetical protein [Dysgonamonadaceae bacterium]
MMNKFFLSLLGVLIAFSAQAQSFVILEGSGNMYATAISSNGNYVVGKIGSARTSHHSFVWTKTGGVVEWDVDNVNPDNHGSAACGVSPGGRVVGISPDPATLVP